MKEKITEHLFRKDQLVLFREFAATVTAALNSAGVKPAVASTDEEKGFSAIMLVVKREDDDAPYGGALNWKDNKWVVDEQIDTGRPYDG